MTDLTPPEPETRFVYRVSQLNNEIRDLLEGTFPLIWVEGELSNFSAPSSGHWYFTLKDEAAQVRSAMFRMRNMHVGFRPREGMQVLLRARVSLYAPRGDFQLIAEHMEQAGDGALRRAFDELKQRLEREGLFAAAHKKTIPAHPRRIGVITSPTGAAIHDILTVLRRRFPAIPVLIYPVPVQGKAAAEQIARTLRLASERQECDVLIVGRGGGSLEDLWAFNEECVARAIFDCRIPVISAVGHETDFTISDFVADARASTPSAAAEMVSPDREEWLKRVQNQERRLSVAMRTLFSHARHALEMLVRRLPHPEQRLAHMAQRADELERRLLNSQQIRLSHARHRLAVAAAGMARQDPRQRLQRLEIQLHAARHRLIESMHQDIRLRRQRLAGMCQQLDLLSPLATLGRGYAIVVRLPERTLVRRADQTRMNDTLEIRFGKGRVRGNVTEIIDD